MRLPPQAGDADAPEETQEQAEENGEVDGSEARNTFCRDESNLPDFLRQSCLIVFIVSLISKLQLLCSLLNTAEH